MLFDEEEDVQNEPKGESAEREFADSLSEPFPLLIRPSMKMSVVTN